MADRPILFSGPMVRALLAGTKTQTRRIIKPQPELQMNGFYHVHNRHGGLVNVAEEDVGREAVDYLRIAVGDQLYVREHWRTGGQHDHIAPRDLPQERAEPIGYIADEAPNTISRTGRFRQGMHMPRWASRITLHVTDVRVQRLQDISRDDALAEGIALDETDGWYRVPGVPSLGQAAPQSAYGDLWDSINGAGSWEANPWVVALTFTVEHANIDSARIAS